MKKYINFKAIGLSLIFLFNPNINIIDILPDFIGYILLCLALINLADINETVSEALAIFKKLIFIDAAKLIALMWVFGISVTSEQNSSLLLWSFAFGVIEIIFAVPAFIKLFNGITELGFLHQNTSVTVSKHSKNGKQRKSCTDKLRTLSIIFICTKSVLSFLPEFSDLTSTEYYENSGMTNLYQYIGTMRFLAFVILLPIAILWIIKVISYFWRLAKDSEFCSALESLYDQNVAPKKGIFIKRNVSAAFVVLITSTVLSFDFRLENVNVIPDFLAAAMLIAFFVIISKRTQIPKGVSITLCVIYLVLSTIAAYFEFAFFKDFYYGAVLRSEDAMLAYIFKIVSACVASVFFAIVCIAVLSALRRVIESHTGILSLSSQEANEVQIRMAEATRNDLKRNLIYCMIATVIYVATDIAYVLLAKDYGFMFLINVVGTIIFIITYVKAYLEITEAVNTKYLLE